MKYPTFEFFVSAYIQGERFRVFGCCGDIPIRVGDVFDAIYRYKPYRDLKCCEEPARDEEIPASIRVTGINAINRDLPMLGQGMTGALTIEGGGIEDITSGWVLGLHSPSLASPNGSAVTVEDVVSA